MARRFSLRLFGVVMALQGVVAAALVITMAWIVHAHPSRFRRKSE